MKKFKDAFNGLKIAFRHKAVIVQIIMAVMAVIGGIIIKLDTHEWLSFVICISMVIMAEIFNTSVERIGDYLNIKDDKRIKDIKDLSSSAVLVAAMGSLIVCVLCLIRRIL